MSIVATTATISIYKGIPFRQKFLVYDSSGKLYSLNSGFLSGVVDGLFVSQTNGGLELQRNDGEVIIDLSEERTASLSTGAGTFSISVHHLGVGTVVVSGVTNVYERSALVGGTTEPWVAPIKIGDAVNFTEFEADGTLHAEGDATMFKDLLQPLIGQRLSSTGGDIDYDFAESSVEYGLAADVNDWTLMNIQINHDWLVGSDIYPHLHWWQARTEIANWLIQYRWQIQGDAKETSWTSAIRTATGVFTWASGTMNQISGFPAITPPVGYGDVSDILQVRLIRDVANGSTLFTGAEATPAAVQAVNFDVHYEVDAWGSREAYVK